MSRGAHSLFRTEQRALALPAADRSRVVVVADTHGRPHPLLQERVATERPAAILHAGDVGERAVLERLAAVAPVHAVRGNIDDRAPDLPDALVLTLAPPGGATLRVYLTHVGVRGTRLLGEVRARAETADAGLVICGHSHVPLLVRDGDLVVFNPGACGPRRFHLPILFGVLDLAAGGATLRHVACETGARWLPPRASGRE